MFQLSKDHDETRTKLSFPPSGFHSRRRPYYGIITSRSRARNSQPALACLTLHENPSGGAFSPDTNPGTGRRRAEVIGMWVNEVGTIDWSTFLENTEGHKDHRYREVIGSDSHIAGFG